MFFAFLLMVFLVFPFTQIVPLESYNQPYAVAWSGIVVALHPGILTSLRSDVRYTLAYLALVGTIMLGIEIISGFALREFIYWLSYVSPILIVPVALWSMQNHLSFVRRALSAGIVIWIAVSMIQLLFDNNFLTFLVSRSEDIGADVLSSGRGALGLAPEPTHNGLHLLVMSASLFAIGGSRIFVMLGLFGVVFLARSTTALFALAVGAALWAVFKPVSRAWFIGAMLAAFVFVLSLAALDSDIRLIRLLSRLLEDGPASLLNDASANARINGVIFPIMDAVRNGLVPLGLSQDAWLDTIYEIIRRNRSIFGLSENGPASGFGLLLVQAGWFALPVLFMMGKVMVWEQRHRLYGLLCIAGFMAFVGQLYLATPSFSLILAACIYASENYRMQKNQIPQHRQIATNRRDGIIEPRPV